MCNFLIDKAFGRQYEEYFADKLSKEVYIDDDTNRPLENSCTLCDGLHDDKGCDIEQKITAPSGAVVGVRRIDVKCYRKPIYKKFFNGAFIETALPKSGRPGWLTDPTKTTTHYLLVINCLNDSVGYDMAYLIDKQDLEYAIKKAIDAGDCEYTTKCSSGHGYILPYKYIEELAEEV